MHFGFIERFGSVIDCAKALIFVPEIGKIRAYIDIDKSPSTNYITLSTELGGGENFCSNMYINLWSKLL